MPASRTTRTTWGTWAWVQAGSWASSAASGRPRWSTAASEAPAAFSARFRPFSPFFVWFSRSGTFRPDFRMWGKWGRSSASPGLVQGLNTAQNQSLFHQSLFAKKTITNFQSWVIPRENKKDRLAQLWNSFENVNIGELFSKLGNTFSSLDQRSLDRISGLETVSGGESHSQDLIPHKKS